MDKELINIKDHEQGTVPKKNFMSITPMLIDAHNKRVKIGFIPPDLHIKKKPS